MFLGHFGVGLAAKRLVPAVSLGTLFLACQLADLIWPNLVLLGIERVEVAPGEMAAMPLRFEHHPFSHSLLGLGLWAGLFAALHWVIRRSSRAALTTIAAAVLSHWVLDVVTHRPDMPLAFAASPRLGLGLWSSVTGTVLVEAALFAGGVVAYLRATRPADRRGSWGFWLLVGLLVLVFAASLVGPPPPSAAAAAWGGQAVWLFVLGGYWVDRHRLAVPASGATRR